MVSNEVMKSTTNGVHTGTYDLSIRLFDMSYLDIETPILSLEKLTKVELIKSAVPFRNGVDKLNNMFRQCLCLNLLEKLDTTPKEISTEENKKKLERQWTEILLEIC